MKKISLGLLSLILSLGIISCAKTEKNAESTSDSKVVKIGITKIIQHPALDAIEEGIMEVIQEAGYEALFDLQNANGDLNTASQIANKFKSDKVDVSVGIATPVAVALANTIKDKPVVFATVTDPIGAGLVSSLDKGEGNVTGLSDAVPTREHIQLLKEITDLKTLGYIYTTKEANSISSLELVESACKEFGIALVTQGISLSSEVKQAADAIVDRVDALYLTTDNTVFSALASITQVFGKAKKPIFASDVTAALDGGCLIASGFNYYKAGRATGEMVVQILEGANPDTMPVRFITEPSDTDLLFDLDVAKACGIDIPEKYLTMANYIFENGELHEK